MRMYLALGPGNTFDIHFPPHLLDELRMLGPLRIQQKEGPLTEEELAREIDDAEVLLSHWGTPRVTAQTLDACPHLRVIAHCAGSVASVCSDAVFDRGLTVLSANWIMSEFVAEGILGYLIAGVRRMPQYFADLKSGVEWPIYPENSLIGARIGFIGLGMVGKRLLSLLAPFRPEVRVYDPYIAEDALEPWPFARRTSMEEALKDAVAISLQAPKTPETFHMVDAAALAALPDGALVVNAARGPVMDTQALMEELRAGRLYAVLDVYDSEPLPLDSPLRGIDRVALMPHRAGAPVGSRMTEGILHDLRRYAAGELLECTVTRRQFELMTQA